ncbi:hypothetical protein H6F76_04455 [Leptolyngbya sp. FACHB-321]|uniref:hypothetical protein n=1 Tax=Leptolyngbya sp. FACHB-321 TaxID=2692807 RepID=UPI0016860D22|nr:hypothetical protein [Leptolyngbya sp. FACHB-321]MBD2034292.1 hypothetical protein [Leptolyngbya sp. FACHB-321]
MLFNHAPTELLQLVRLPSLHRIFIDPCLNERDRYYQRDRSPLTLVMQGVESQRVATMFDRTFGIEIEAYAGFKLDPGSLLTESSLSGRKSLIRRSR